MGLMDPINVLGEIGVDVLACGPQASRSCPPRAVLRAAGRTPFTVVVDREDDACFTRTVLAAHDVMVGNVVVHPTVGGGGRLLWHDILYAVADGDRRYLRAPVTATYGSPQQQERAVGAWSCSWSSWPWPPHGSSSTPPHAPPANSPWPC